MLQRARRLLSRFLPRRLMGHTHGPIADGRSKRMVFLIECLLNQNARDQGAAESPAVERALIDLLLSAEVGMVQIPCPEIACLGFERKRAAGQSLKQALQAEQPAACCRDQAAITAARIQAYLEQGYTVIAILGGNTQSPGCAVHASDAQAVRLKESSGVFMQALAQELAQRGCRIPFRGIRDADPDLLEQDLQWLQDRLS